MMKSLNITEKRRYPTGEVVVWKFREKKRIVLEKYQVEAFINKIVPVGMRVISLTFSSNESVYVTFLTNERGKFYTIRISSHDSIAKAYKTFSTSKHTSLLDLEDTLRSSLISRRKITLSFEYEDYLFLKGLDYLYENNHYLILEKEWFVRTNEKGMKLRSLSVQKLNTITYSILDKKYLNRLKALLNKGVLRGEPVSNGIKIMPSHIAKELMLHHHCQFRHRLVTTNFRSYFIEGLFKKEVDFSLKDYSRILPNHCKENLYIYFIHYDSREKYVMLTLKSSKRCKYFTFVIADEKTMRPFSLPTLRFKRFQLLSNWVSSIKYFMNILDDDSSSAFSNFDYTDYVTATGISLLNMERKELVIRKFLNINEINEIVLLESNIFSMLINHSETLSTIRRGISKGYLMTIPHSDGYLQIKNTKLGLKLKRDYDYKYLSLFVRQATFNEFRKKTFLRYDFNIKDFRISKYLNFEIVWVRGTIRNKFLAAFKD